MDREENPYKVLHLEQDASIDEVKKAFYYVAQMYHPHKGGNEQQFLRFQKAYQQIVDAYNKGHAVLVAPKSYNELKQGGEIKVKHRYQPADFRKENRFNQGQFNEKFQKEAKTKGSYTYDVNHLTASDRDPTHFKSEYARVTTEAEGITPMFSQGGFNSQTFNHAFVRMKEQHQQQNGELEEYGEPEPTLSREIVSCIDLNDPQGQNMENLYDKAYGLHRNPDTYQDDFLAQCRDQPDITKETRLSQGELRSRMDQYNRMDLKYNKDKLITDRTSALQEVEGLESSKARQQLTEQQQHLASTRGVEAHFDRMMSLRDMAGGRMTGVLDRPTPTTTNYRDMQNVVYEPAPLLVQPQQHLQQSMYGQPPPLYKKKQHKNELEHELHKVKRVVRKQQKAIQQLLHRA